MKVKRGRPPEYDTEQVLLAACEVFWRKGFSATSLDDLSAAMGMNRPSIYKAFGDKQAIYRRALTSFAERMETGFQRTLLGEPDIRRGLRRFFRHALDLYTEDGMARGCMVMCTAPAAAVEHPEIQADLQMLIRLIDEKIRKRVELAIKEGQLRRDTDSKTLSNVLQALQQSLAIRARAGESKYSLRRFIDGSLELVLGGK